MGRGVDWRQRLQDLADQVLNLTSVQWGFILITAAAAFAFVWVMGEPQKRSAPAGAAAVAAGLIVALGVVLVRAHARRLA